MAYVFAPKKLLFFFSSECKGLCKQKAPRQTTKKSYIENCSWYTTWGGCRSIQLLDILRKWLRMHTDSPELRPGFGACVYLESYSWGEGKEQQSSNRATESLFLVLFAVGSFQTPFLSSPPRIKSGGVKKTKRSRPRGEQTHQYKKNQMSSET